MSRKHLVLFVLFVSFVVFVLNVVILIRVQDFDARRSSQHQIRSRETQSAGIARAPRINEALIASTRQDTDHTDYPDRTDLTATDAGCWHAGQRPA